MPWDTGPTWQEYNEHYATYPGPTKCPFSKVYHNLAPYLAQMKKLGKQSCACIQGYDINTGTAKGDNYTQQATPSERKRVWEIFKAIEDKSSEQWNATPRSDVGARARIRELAREQRYEETLKVVRHWQSIKQAKQQGSHSSAAAEVDTSAVQQPPTAQQAPVQGAGGMTEQEANVMSTVIELDSVDHSPLLCLNATCNSCPLPRIAWNGGDPIHIPLPRAGAHTSDATERDTESPGEVGQNGKGRDKRTTAKFQSVGKARRGRGKERQGKSKGVKSTDSREAKPPVVLNDVEVTEPASSTLREIQQAALGFSTPYDASSRSGV
jgi:hypothetical protein